MSKRATITLIIVVLIIIIAIIAYAMTRTPAVDNSSLGTVTSQNSTTDTASQDATTMTASTSPADTTATSSAVGTVGTTKAFTVTGSNFSFSPKTLTVKKGDTVKITFKNVSGFHDLHIDEFNVATPRIQGGQSATVTFVADKAGNFEYYCSVANHRAMGMVGTLTVTE